MKNNKQQGGFIKIVLIIIVIVLILSYFGVNLRGVVESPAAQANFTYLKDLVLDFWTTYLGEPLLKLWANISAPFKNGLK